MFSHQYYAGQLQIGRAFLLLTVRMSDAVRSPLVLKVSPSSLSLDSGNTYMVLSEVLIYSLHYTAGLQPARGQHSVLHTAPVCVCVCQIYIYINVHLSIISSTLFLLNYLWSFLFGAVER